MKDVIVMGKNYSSTLGVARALGASGYGVRLLALSKYTKKITGSCKYITKCYDYICKGNPEFDKVWEGLEVLRDQDEHILIIPVHDYSCMMLDEFAGKLSAHYIIPNLFGKAGELTRFMDKMVQKELAQECGLPVARGNTFSTDEKGIKTAVGKAKFPCFMKAVASAKSVSSKTLFAKCKNGKELELAMQKAAKQHCLRVLAEDYLEIDKELCVYGVAGNGKVYIPACMETLRGGFGDHKGVAAEGIVSTANILGDVKIKLVEFVKRSGLTGLFCIDLILSKGTVYFSEMNLRGGGSGYGMTLAGANLPGTLADIVYNNSATGPEDIERNVHFLNEMIELEAYVDGYITCEEYRKHMSGESERFMQSEIDPRPWKEFKNLSFRKLFFKRVGTLFRKK